MPLVIVVGFVVGVVLYWIAVHRVIGQPPLMSLLATFAVNMMLIGLGTALWSTSPYNVPVSLPGVSLAAATPSPARTSWRRCWRVVIAGAALSAALPHAHRQGDARRRQQPRGGRARRHSDDAGAVAGLRARRGARLRVGHADRDAVSVHRAVGRRLSAQELRRDRARRARQSGGRAARRHRARPDRGPGDAVHAGELDAGDRIRAVRRRA